MMMMTSPAEHRLEEEIIMEESDPVADYRQSLSDLVMNSKPLILMLTMLADEAKETKALEIVECIEQRLLQVKGESKLPTLYLVDSICKNIPTSLYKELFQKRIIKLFCHTFERVDDRTRIMMYKLRQTWNEIFSPDVLYQLDLTVSKMDSGWPVSSKPKSTNTVNTNGQEKQIKSIVSLPGPSKTNAEQKPPEQLIKLIKSNANLSQAEIELRQQLTAKHLAEKLNSNASNTKSTLEANKPKPSCSNSLNTSGKGNKKHTKGHLGDKAKSLGLMDSDIKAEPLDSLPKSFKKKRETKRKKSDSERSISPPPKQSKKSALIEPIIPAAPDNVIPLGRDHHVSVTKRIKPEPPRSYRNEQSSLVNSIKSRRSPPPRRRSPSLSSNQSKSVPSEPPQAKSLLLPTSTIQTSIPAPNVFAQPEMLFGFNSSSESPTSFGSMDRDYRREFVDPSSHAEPPPPAQLNPPTVGSGPPVSQAPPPSSSVFHPPTSAPFSTPAPSPMPAPLFPGLVEPYGSTVLYINRELVRLYFLDNITALVIKAHPDTPFDQLLNYDPKMLEPKQVFFSGLTTTVWVDRGLPHEQSFRLEFNDPVPVTFYLSGLAIPQRMMLGLPTREFVVNGVPYQANFGGPPINVFMDCDGQCHSYQLSDSRPFLKFSDDLRFDLWVRLVNEAKAKASAIAPLPPSTPQLNASYAFPPPSTVAPSANNPTLVPHTSQQLLAPSQDSSSASAPVADLSSLLSKLTAAGLINKNSSFTPTTVSSYTTTASTQSNTNVQSGTLGNNKKSRRDRKRNKQHQQQQQQEQENGPKKFLSLEVSTLKKNHKFVIDQLYSGVPCTNCSLRFPGDALKEENGKKSRYARHLDWHFRQNRREKTKPDLSSSTSSAAHRRPWCYTSDLWVLYKEVNDDAQEESSAGFFDSLAANSPSSLSTANSLNFDFTPFKQYISDFDAFLEAINCDTSTSEMKSCSVVSDSDVANTCAVCQEAFDLKWLEDEEEWRLINAVSYDDLYSIRYFHPLCLKDYFIQQHDKTQSSGVDDNSTLSQSETDKGFVIPGLDAPQVEDDERRKSVEEESVTIKTENADDESLETSMVGLKVEEEESASTKIAEEFEVKVEEFEIPIPAPIKLEEMEESVAEGELSNGPIVFAPQDDPMGTDECTNSTTSMHQQFTDSVTQSPPPSDNSESVSKPQPKRGGIVIKMKRSVPAISSSNEQCQSGNVVIATVLSEDSNLSLEASNDSFKPLNKASDDTDDAPDSTGAQSSGSQAALAEDHFAGSLQDNEAETELTESSENVSSSAVAQEQLQGVESKEVVEESITIDSVSLQSHESDNTQPNYYSRGREESSLCTIM